MTTIASLYLVLVLSLKTLSSGTQGSNFGDAVGKKETWNRICKVTDLHCHELLEIHWLQEVTRHCKHFSEISVLPLTSSRCE